MKCRNWNVELEKSKNGKKASLVRAVLKTFAKRLFGTGLLLLILVNLVDSLPLKFRVETFKCGVCSGSSRSDQREVAGSNLASQPSW